MSKRLTALWRKGKLREGYYYIRSGTEIYIHSNTELNNTDFIDIDVLKKVKEYTNRKKGKKETG